MWPLAIMWLMPSLFRTILCPPDNDALKLTEVWTPEQSAVWGLVRHIWSDLGSQALPLSKVNLASQLL